MVIYNKMLFDIPYERATLQSVLRLPPRKFYEIFIYFFNSTMVYTIADNMTYSYKPKELLSHFL